jgi:putative chitinase
MGVLQSVIDFVFSLKWLGSKKVAVLDPETLDACTGCGLEVARKWAEPLNHAMAIGEINTPLRKAAFLAQVAHETGGFVELTENLNYSAEALLTQWPLHFTKDNVQEYAHNPEKIANRAYANRDGNGDEASGDGWKFRGRGLDQMTGREAYRGFSAYLGVDVETNPDLVASNTSYCALAAIWEWNKGGCNALADAGEFKKITEYYNGGLIGEEHREMLYAKAKATLIPRSA